MNFYKDKTFIRDNFLLNLGLLKLFLILQSKNIKVFRSTNKSTY